MVASLYSFTALLLWTALNNARLQAYALVTPCNQVVPGPHSPTTASALSRLSATETAPATCNTKFVEISYMEIHVGGIDWNIPPKQVQSQLDHFTRDLQVQRIEIKPTTSKSRDVGKCHGGSARIYFENNVVILKIIRYDWVYNTVGNLFLKI